MPNAIGGAGGGPYRGRLLELDPEGQAGRGAARFESQHLDDGVEVGEHQHLPHPGQGGGIHGHRDVHGVLGSEGGGDLHTVVEYHRRLREEGPAHVFPTGGIQRVAGHGEPNDELKKRRILVDGAPTEGQGLLLQIFTQNVIGPIFFEIIQRKGNEGFGEGNFKALFESIELDQMRRGVI